jgi:hypothetical protein
MPHRCAACEDEAKAHRVADDNPDTKYLFPRQPGVGDPGSGGQATPTPVPATAPTTPEAPVAAPGATADPAPMKDGGAAGPGSAGSCCDAALARGLDGGDFGGIICCNGSKFACVWQSNINRRVLNAAARPIVERCVRVHETTHLGQVDCTGAALERPNFRAGVDPDASECAAFRAEVQCYNVRLADCGADAECRNQVTTQLDFAQRERTRLCGA